MATGPTPVISEDLARGIRLNLATQGGGRAEEMISLLNRSLEIEILTQEDATFSQETIQLNEGGTTASLGGAGMEWLGDGGNVVGYVRVDPADISLLQIKAPTGFELELDINADSTLLMSQDFAVTGASPVTINQSVSTTSAVIFASITLGATTLVSSILDEDNMASDSATALATQQSIKAFVDAAISASDSWEEALAVANISGANDVIVTTGQKITVDTISETTANSGVTIEALTIENEVGFVSMLTSESGDARIDWGRNGADTLELTTDAGGFVESAIFMTSTENTFAFNTGAFVVNATESKILDSAGVTKFNATTTLTLITGGTNGISFFGTAAFSIFQAGGTASIKTGTTVSDTLRLQARDVDGATDVDFITFTSSNDPTCDLSSAVTIGGNAILDSTNIGSSVQAFGAILDDLNTLGAPASDGQFIVATGAGVFTYESGATARTSLGLGTFAVESVTAVPSLTMADAANIALNTTAGTKIGTATAQKLGFWNATPVIQQTTGVSESVFVENSGGAVVNVDSTFGGYTAQQIVQALQNIGALA